MSLRVIANCPACAAVAASDADFCAPEALSDDEYANPPAMMAPTAAAQGISIPLLFEG
jgi:hypothetical protein